MCISIITFLYYFYLYCSYLLCVSIYINSFQYYHERQCSQCHSVPQEISICLLCGTIVCLKQNCCKQMNVCEAIQVSTIYMCTRKYGISFAYIGFVFFHILILIHLAFNRLWRWDWHLPRSDLDLHYRDTWSASVFMGISVS